MPSADKIALQVGNVTKRFGGLIAVQNLSFALAENEVLGLIGPNGSGEFDFAVLVLGGQRQPCAPLALVLRTARRHAPRRSAGRRVG